MSFLSPPSAPNPTQTANQQAAYNQQAAQTQQKLNMFGQTNPYGTEAWNVDPNSPSGYTANINLAPAYQKMLDIIQGTQTSLGGAGQSLAANTAGMYGQAPDLSYLSGQTGQQLQGLFNQYQAPIFKQQESNLTAQLLNQGLTPGSEAWNNAQNLQARNEANATQSFTMGMEPQAFNQAVTQYQLPLQTTEQLMQAGAPTMPNQYFAQTPTSQVQPPDYQTAVAQQYQAQMANYQNMMKGLFAVPTALAGGWAMGGFPGMSGLSGLGSSGVGAGLYGGVPYPIFK
jgi:hypothetical protein